MFLPVGLKVSGKLCVLVGGGEVAARRCRVLLENGARVRVVARLFSDDPVWMHEGVEKVQRDYKSSDLAGALLAITADDDPRVNRDVVTDCKAAGVLVFCEDDLETCDWALLETLRQGEVQRLRSLAEKMSRDTNRRKSPLRDLADAESDVWHRGGAPCYEVSEGKVSLVFGGADPELMTVKGVECLRSASLVIHDSVKQSELLDRYCNGALRICVEKILPEMLVDWARKGNRVVGLSGARNDECAVALADAGIEYEIVPGVDDSAIVRSSEDGQAAKQTDDRVERQLEVLLVRHAEIEEKYQGRYIGCLDVSLGKKGFRQAATLATVAELHRPGLVFASPMLRVRQTLAEADVEQDCRWLDDLREIDFGNWENLNFAEIIERDPVNAANWAKLDGGFAFPGGDSLESFQRRVSRAATEMVAQAHADESCRRIYVFAHGGVIRSLIAHWLGLPMRSHLLLEVSRASISMVRLYGDCGVLTKLNDTAHLQML